MAILKGNLTHEGKDYLYTILIDEQAMEHCDSPAHSLEIDIQGEEEFSISWFYKKQGLNGAIKEGIERRKVVPGVVM